MDTIKTVTYRIYINLTKMYGYRNIALRGDVMNEDKFVAMMNHNEFVMLIGDRPAADVRGPGLCYTILIAPGSKYSLKSMDFKKLLKGLPKDDHLEVMFVSENEFSTHLHNQVAEFKKANPAALIETYTYEMFIVEKPKHINVPLHEIASDSEIDKFCADYFCQRENLPKIVTSEPQVVWLGARPGMVIKIHRVSETAGMAVIYRYVIKG